MLTLRFICLFFLASLANLALAAENPTDPFANPPTPAFIGQTNAPQAQQTNISMDIVLSGLQGSRALVSLPNNSVLVAEGSGNIQLIHPNGSVTGPVSGMPPLRSGEGRILMDITADANFAQNRRIFFAYEAAPSSGEGEPVGQIASGVLSRDMTRFENIQILGNYPGRRLASTTEGELYITTIGYFERRPELMD